MSVDWQKLGTESKDGTPFLIYGKWRPYMHLIGGTPEIYIASWTTLQSKADAPVELMVGWHRSDNWNVDWTHWAPLPEGPDASA